MQDDVSQMMPLLQELKADIQKLEKVVLVCDKNCHQCERLLAAIEETTVIRRSLVSAAAIEEQTISVIRRLTDRFKEREENIGRVLDQVQELVSEVHLMTRHFHTLEERLIDAIHCPMRPPEHPPAGPA
jgi:Mg2+ and Co2+ transporter CorA